MTNLLLTMELENDFARFYFSGEYLYYIYKAGKTIDLAAAKQIVADRISFQEGKSYPVICFMQDVKYIDKAARDYLADKGSELVKAVAIISGSTARMHMINFYLTVNKPKVPTRMVANEEEAKQYLQKYML